jgi:hypothetical protein
VTGSISPSGVIGAVSSIVFFKPTHSAVWKLVTPHARPSPYPAVQTAGCPQKCEPGARSGVEQLCGNRSSPISDGPRYWPNLRPRPIALGSPAHSRASTLVMWKIQV